MGLATYTGNKDERTKDNETYFNYYSGLLFNDI